MNAILQANTGTETIPVWKTLSSSDRIHFSGAGSTPTLVQPIIKPVSGYVYPEECWIGPDVMAGGVRVMNWVKPSAVTQKGIVFKATFSDALLAAPVITAFDDTEAATWDIDALTGTEETNWTGLIKCAVTGSQSVNTPPATGWATKTTGHAGNGNPNSLQGNSQFVTVPTIPIAGGNFTFTICPVIASDCENGKADKYDPLLTIIYVYV